MFVYSFIQSVGRDLFPVPQNNYQVVNRFFGKGDAEAKTGYSCQKKHHMQYAWTIHNKLVTPIPSLPPTPKYMCKACIAIKD